MNLIKNVTSGSLRSLRAGFVVCSLSALLGASQTSASVTINYDFGELKSGGSNISTGTFFIFGLGLNNTLDSLSWTSGTSFLRGDDKLLAAVAISNGVAQGALAGLDISIPGLGTQLAGVFLSGIDSTRIDYTTGTLRSIAIGLEPSVQLTFSSNISLPNAQSYGFGNYRTDNIEKFGAATPGDNIAWIVPADGGTYNLSAYSGTGDYTGNDITASLITTSSFIVIPEPNSGSLLVFGLLMIFLFQIWKAGNNRDLDVSRE